VHAAHACARAVNGASGLGRERIVHSCTSNKIALSVETMESRGVDKRLYPAHSKALCSVEGGFALQILENETCKATCVE